MTLTPSQLLASEAPARRPVIVMSEGIDPRIVAGSLAAAKDGLAEIILVGPHDAVATELNTAGGADAPFVTIHDPETSAMTPDLAELFYQLRKHKSITPERAQQAALDPLVYAALLVRAGHADGTVGGAITTTSDVVRAALQVIGKAPDAALVSSFFLMYPPAAPQPHARAMLYSDCGLVIDPSSEELAAIAAISAGSFRALMRDEPKIAMLSFSTKGSAKHTDVAKVTEATDLLRSAHPELKVDGELQFDAAFVPSVGQSKAPGSDVAGAANVMIFPTLDAGNIGYKITQRLGGYTAIGPVLQGLAKPANDLSRGCVAGDVTEMIAVTALQAGHG